jgi:hypothetical protein
LAKILKIHSYNNGLKFITKKAVSAPTVLHGGPGEPEPVPVLPPAKVPQPGHVP